jgi:hypothetical protein
LNAIRHWYFQPFRNPSAGAPTSRDNPDEQTTG